MRRSLSIDEKKTLFDYLEFRFGLSRDLFKDFYLERTKRDVWMMPIELSRCMPESVNIEKRGLRAFNGEKHPPKPTSIFVQRFGSLMTKSCVEVSAQQLSLFFDGQTLEGAGSALEQGYVVIKRFGVAIGCGFVRNGNIESQFPLETGRSIGRKFL